MPTYVYECSSCNDVYEVEQRITEDSLKDCRCGSLGTLKRVIQPVGISFKGSGFYVNDSKSVSSPASKTDSVDSSDDKTKPEDKPIPPAPTKTELPKSVDTTPSTKSDP
ncbi:MAG: hypothetical protein H7Y17_13890 [Chlorobia bacterium]|nr:hypothetical protein [Fimbriimonadaceae bacterium]